MFGTVLSFLCFLVTFEFSGILCFMCSRYDLHSGSHDSIGNHDDTSTCVGYSDETCKLAVLFHSHFYWILIYLLNIAFKLYSSVGFCFQIFCRC